MIQTNNNSKEIEWLLKEKYNGEKTEAFFVDVDRIKKGEPSDYVIGFSNFLGTKINLDYKPLIPRNETEYWVEKAITKIKEKFGDTQIKVLDIFSGSGCVGIAILKHIPNAHVDFSEVDKNMALQIKKNLDINNISENRYKIFVSDVFDQIDNNEKYDVVLANPPYIDKSRNVTQESVLMYEPHTALFSENNGIQIIEKFVSGMRNFIKNDFLIFVEHDDDQVERIKSLLVSNGYTNFNFCNDQFGLPRWVEIGE
jgi:release factor glutamine methyltransferase